MDNTENKNTKRNMEPTLTDIMAKLGCITDVMQKLEGITNSVNKIENRLSKLEEIQTKVIEVEKSQEYLGNKFEEQRAEFKGIKKENEQLRKENKELMNKVNNIERKMETEKQKRIQLEQYGRRDQIEISGIPQMENEDCKIITKSICQKLKATIEDSKIEIAHRITNGNIIVKFQDRVIRDEIYRQKYKLKDISIKDLGYGNEGKIYINESLAFDTKKLLKEVRSKCKELGYKQIMTENGITKFKKNTRWVKIYSEDDMNKYVV